MKSEAPRQPTAPPTEYSGDLAIGHGPARNTMFSFASQIIGAVFTLGLTLFLVRKLGPTNYGILALAVGIGLILQLLSDFGIPHAAARFTAESPTDRVHVAAVLRTAIALKLLTTAVMVIGLVLLAPLIADAYGVDDLTLPLRLIAIAVAGQGIGGLFLSWFTALGRVSVSLRYQLVQSTFETSASVLFVLLGAGAAGAAAGKAIGYTVGGVLVAALAFRLVGWSAAKSARERGFPSREIFGYGAVIVLINTAIAIFGRLDVLIIGGILGPADAGQFDAALRITTFLLYPGIAVAAGFAPRLAEGRRSASDTALFMLALRYTILFYFLLVAPTVVWAKPISGLLLGDSFSASAPVLAALAPAVVLFGIGEVLAVGVNYLGAAKSRVPLAIGALLINGLIDVILVPQIGIIAGAIGTGVALIVYVGGHVRIYQRKIGVSFANLIPAVARGLAAAIVAAAVLFAFGTEHLSLFAVLAAPPLATLGYLGVLVALRELSPNELRTALALIRRQLRRGAEDAAPVQGT
jgi:PST family polysaccharide transporter